MFERQPNKMPAEHNHSRSMGLPFLLSFSVFVSVAHGQSPQNPENPENQGNYQEPFVLNLTESWLDPWPHQHFSRRGTPFVHTFILEPAFMDRDAFLDYRSAQGAEGNETEMEMELEWAFTRRIGVAIEAPFVTIDPAGTSSESGLGDIAIAPRVLLVDSAVFLLSGNLEISFPSGKESKGFGSGELGLAPSLSAWFDFGNWVQGSAQVGSEHGLESGYTEIFYSSAFAYTFLAPSLLDSSNHAHNQPGSHYPQGMTNCILEFTGRTVINGLEEGRSSSELLVGVSYSLTEMLEFRGGYQFPVGGNQGFARGFTLGLVAHL